MNTLFPHEQIRESQKELMEKIQEVLKKNQNLIAHAPTGLGKTAACISEALTFAIKNKKTIVFVTPKHTQHRIAIETARLIKQKYKIDLKVVDLIGKRWLCSQSNIEKLASNEFSDYCRNLTENSQCLYYMNTKNKHSISIQARILIKEIENKIQHAEQLKTTVKKSKLCPYEISCILARKSKIIIADYNHILSKSIRGNLLEKINKNLDDLIIIIDEAHNLPEKARELLTSKISTFTIKRAIKEIQSVGYKDISETVSKLNDILEKLSRKKTTIEETESLITKEELIKEIQEITDYNKLIDDLDFINTKLLEKKKRSYTGSITSFLINWLGPDEQFTRILKKDFYKNKPFISITYKCLDPSIILKPLSENCYSLICMSGTLTPTDVYKDLIGIQAETAEYKNPFPSKNRLNILIPETTTKYTQRNQEMYKKIADHCSKIINSIPGNSAVFFPSYQLRDQIYVYIKNKCEKTTFLEQRGLTKQEKAEIIEKFKSYNKQGATLLGVTSGNFAEGLDLPGDYLKAVIIVGLPLARPDLETKELIKYYDKKYNKGWDYGYIIPAIIKTQQGAGRCIRSETDKGVIVHLDERYTWSNYFRCFTKEDYLRITRTPIERIKEFFENQN